MKGSYDGSGCKTVPVTPQSVAAARKELVAGLTIRDDEHALAVMCAAMDIAAMIAVRLGVHGAADGFDLSMRDARKRALAQEAKDDG